MNLPYDLLPGWLHWLATTLFLPLASLAALRADWQRFNNRSMVHILLGSTVLLLLIWGLKAGIKPGLNFHLLGGTLFMLMFGWEIAFLALSTVIAGSMLNGAIPWQSFAINALLMAALPSLFAHWVYRLAVWYLPHNFFVYILLNAFLCAGLSMAVLMLTSSLLLIGFGVYSTGMIMQGYLPYTPFMMFGEGFLTGMLVAGMALTKPGWLLTFDDRLYLAGK